MASPDRYTRRGNYYVRRPQATYVQPETLRQTVKRHWPEIVGGVAVLLGTWIGLPWALALAVTP